MRDRLGKKPLYYAESNGAFRFASELKAIVARPSFERDVDPDALRLVPALRLRPVALDDLSRRAQASARRTTCSARTARTTVDAVLGSGARTRSQRQPSDATPTPKRELEARLSTAVRQRMIADVPLGAFLSGGIDSSLVVALMQEQSATPVRTFTIRFDNPEFNEADHAAAVARHLGTDHHEQTCDDRADALDVVDRLPSMFDEPFADSSAVPTYLVSKIGARAVTVALSGDGGDELFFGYPRYRYHSTAATCSAMPRSLRRAAAFGADRMPTRRLRRIADVLRSDETDHYARFVSWWRSAEVATLTGAARRPRAVVRRRPRAAAGLARDDSPGLLDLVSYLPEDILDESRSRVDGREPRGPRAAARSPRRGIGARRCRRRSSGGVAR